MITKGYKVNDRYEIIKNIGEGGMANVYLANDIILGREVAVKILRGDLALDEKFVRRFQREALSASSLSHPNIVEMYDVGEDDGKYYIVMEFIEGKTLKQLIKKRGFLTVPEVIDIMLQLTDGLAHAHDSYIIHRDIKPQNVLILDNGLVKLTDFGIAMALNSSELTQTNSVMGSVHYLPPEQASGRGSTIKSDIYSLGIIMYELLTGKLPFKGENAVEIALKQLKDQMPNIRKQMTDIPQSIENIILKATAKNPKNRYNDAREMYQDLKTALDEDQLDQPRHVYKYLEHDLEETKVMPVIKVEKNKQGDDVMATKINDKDTSKPSKLIKILVGVFLGLLTLLAIIFILIPFLTNVPDVKIPDVSGKSIVNAEGILKKLGFKVKLETKKVYSDSIKEGMVVETDPKSGRTVKKGTTITLHESLGTKYLEVEDYKGQNYLEVKAILETVHGLNVLIEKKEVDNPDNFDPDLIIEQNPEKGAKLVEGDTIVLYIPNIVEKYPDMVGEAWTLSDAEAFAEKYELVLNVEYRETNEYAPDIVIEQKRAAGSVVVKGVTLKIVVSKEPVSGEEEIIEE
ncbi:MAG: Stk1 family PASTA domain-containing Ser/Thr kinase [Bacilli bacterium]|nr:Stk1 family PASTA domain-containing Ser/Thr kinase [Bacilli bacterium]